MGKLGFPAGNAHSNGGKKYSDAVKVLISQCKILYPAFKTLLKLEDPKLRKCVSVLK